MGCTGSRLFERGDVVPYKEDPESSITSKSENSSQKLSYKQKKLNMNLSNVSINGFDRNYSIVSTIHKSMVKHSPIYEAIHIAKSPKMYNSLMVKVINTQKLENMNLKSLFFQHLDIIR